MRKRRLILGLLLIGVSYLWAQHKSDPNDALNKYSIYATDTISFGDQGYGQGTLDIPPQKIDSCVLPGPGLIGSNGVFNMELVPTQSKITKIGTDLVVGGNGNSSKLVLPVWGVPGGIQLQSGKKVFLDKNAILEDKKNNNSIFANAVDKSTSVIKPVESSDVWYQGFKLEDFPPVVNAQDGKDVIVPGSYDMVRTLAGGNTVTLDCGTDDGVFYIKNLVIDKKTKILVKKSPLKFCRVFIGNEIVHLDENVVISPIDPVDPAAEKDRGRTILYFTATSITSANMSFATKAPVVNATIIAPRAKVVINNYMNLGGQLFARSIHFTGAFNASGFEYIPVKTSNIKITPPESLPEDKTGKKPSIKYPTTGYDTTITCELSVPAPDQAGKSAVVDYYILKETPAKGIATNGGVDFDIVETGSFTFGPKESKKDVLLSVIDDAIYEGDETFTVVFKAGTNTFSNFRINLGKDSLVHTIKIIDNDPDNTAPKDLAFSSSATREFYTGVPVQTVGSFSAKDEEGHAITYSISNIKDGSATSRDTWFAVSGSTLVTAPGYAADYEVISQQNFTADMTARDSQGLLSQIKPIAFTITPWNDNKLQVKPDAKSVNEGASVDVDVRVNDTPDADVGGENLKNIIGVSKDSIVTTALSFVTVRGATVSTNGLICTYNDGTSPVSVETPTTEVFYYTVRDTAIYGYPTAHYDSVVRVTITIVNQNDNTPTANNDSTTIFEGGVSSAINVISNDSDLDDPTKTKLAIKSIAPATITGATVTISADRKSLTYDHSKVAASIEQFRDSILYTLTDGDTPERTTTAFFKVIINPVNDNKSDANNDSTTATAGVRYSVKRGETVSYDVANGVLKNDTDGDEHPTATPNNGNVLTASLKSSSTTAKGGVVTLNSDGSFTYDAKNVVFNTTEDQFEYYLNDDISYQAMSKAPFDHPKADSAVVKILIGVNYDSKPDAQASQMSVKEIVGIDGTNSIDLDLLASDADEPEDVLSYALGISKVQSLDGVHGTFSLTGSNLTYSYTATAEKEIPFVETVLYAVTDKGGNTASNTITINIIKLNDNAPVAVTDSVVTIVTGILGSAFDPTANDTDGDSLRSETTLKLADLSRYIATEPRIAKLSRTSDNSITAVIPAGVAIDPNSKFDDFFEYRIIDPVGYDSKVNESVGKVYLKFVAQNTTGPTVSEMNLKMYEGESKSFNVIPMITDADLPNDKHTVTIVSASKTGAGKATVDANGVITYTASPDTTVEINSDEFTYEVADKGGLKVVKTVPVAIDWLNDNAPKTIDGIVDVWYGQPNTILPITFAPDGDSTKAKNPVVLDNGAAAIVSNKTEMGTVTRKSNSELSYTIKAGVIPDSTIFQDTIVYQVIDTTDYDPNKTVHRVTGKLLVRFHDMDENAPRAAEDTIVLLENAIQTILKSGETKLTANDTVGLAGDAFKSIEIVTPNDNTIGILTIDKDNFTFSYDHNDDSEVFFDRFTYRVIDANGRKSTPKEVLIVIDTLNDNDFVVTNETTTVTEGAVSGLVPVTANDVRDKDVLTEFRIKRVISQPAFITTVTLNADSTGLTFTHDGSEGTTSGMIIVELTDKVSYDTKEHLNPDTVFFTVIAVNDNVPDHALGEITVDENKSASLDMTSQIFDKDLEDTLRVRIYRDGVRGVMTVSQENMKIVFTYDHNDSIEYPFKDTVVYSVSDGKNVVLDSIIVTILPKNDNKILAVKNVLNVSEKGANSVVISGNNSIDIDRDANGVLTVLKYAISKDGTNGTATVDQTGKVTFVHNKKNLELLKNLLDTVVVTITDTVSYDPLVGHPVADTVIVTITPSNDNKPVITGNVSVDVLEGREVGVNLRKLVTDADGDVPTIIVDFVTKFGTVTQFSDSIVYLHDGSEPAILNGIFDTLKFVAKDADSTVQGAIVLRIINRNDTPANYLPDSYSVKENQLLIVPANLGVLANDSDADLPGNVPTVHNVLTAEISTKAKFGVVDLKPDGSFTYQSNGAGIEERVDQFTYIVKDSSIYDTAVHKSIPVVVTINVENVNDETPVALGDTIDVKEGESASVLRSGKTSLLELVSDKDSGDIKVSVDPLFTVKAGTLLLDPKGTFTYTHDGSEIYRDSFKYIATDGLFQDTATITIIVAAKPPVMNSDSTRYLDVNADGTVDQIRAVFNHSVNLDSTLFAAKWVDDVAKPVVLEIGKATHEGIAKNVVLIPLGKTGINKTSGAMNITITHVNFDNLQFNGTVKDGAAPVVASAFYQVLETSALLNVTMSEIMEWTSEVPFTFVLNKKNVVYPVGKKAPATGTTYAFTLAQNSLTINSNDSIFVNIAGAVSDGIITQLNPLNVRRPFVFEDNIVSAIYRDTNIVKDGLIDVIKLTTGTGRSITDAELINGLKTGLVLPRGLTLTSIVPDSNGCEIHVKDPAVRGEVKTSVTDGDTLSTSAIISSIGAGTLGKISGLKILDGIAPVINNAFYQIEKNNKGSADTTLTVLYSELVQPITALNSDHPFGFLDASSKKEFDMGLTSEKGNRFIVTDLTIDYVVDGDSIRIAKPLSVYDSVGNAQSLTVWAPIRVNFEYAIDIQILIAPQPLVINKDSKGKVSVQELDPGLREHYRFQQNGVKGQDGVAFIVEATGPLSAAGKHSATAVILDQTGNSVSEKFTFVFGEKVGGNLAGVAVWDGKNMAGRSVGAGSYLLAVEASVETDEGVKSRIIQKSVIKTVGVKYP